VTDKEEKEMMIADALGRVEYDCSKVTPITCRGNKDG